MACVVELMGAAPASKAKRARKRPTAPTTVDHMVVEGRSVSFRGCVPRGYEAGTGLNSRLYSLGPDDITRDVHTTAFRLGPALPGTYASLRPPLLNYPPLHVLCRADT